MFVLFTISDHGHGTENDNNSSIAALDSDFDKGFMTDSAVKLLYGLFTAVTVIGVLTLAFLRQPPTQIFASSRLHNDGVADESDDQTQSPRSVAVDYVDDGDCSEENQPPLSHWGIISKQSNNLLH